MQYSLNAIQKRQAPGVRPRLQFYQTKIKMNCLIDWTQRPQQGAVLVDLDYIKTPDWPDAILTAHAANVARPGLGLIAQGVAAACRAPGKCGRGSLALPSAPWWG